ncbi:MAG: hypothetical protein ACOZEN_13230 [Thermodesulfobacteriota bacterium]
MTSDHIGKLAHEHGITRDEAEQKWKQAVKRAKDEGHAGDHHAHAVSIFRSMVGKPRRSHHGHKQ